MRRRTLVTLLALAVLIALAAIAPQTPPGRAWLLGRARAALQSSGIVLDYREATGNPWTGVHLDGASVRAPGLELRVSSLDVRYFLPSLLTGELPLAVTMDGVRGSVDVTALTRAGRSAGSAGLPVTPVLQELTVSDASLTVQQVPYTLPSGAVSNIRIRQRGDTLDVQAHLRTADGSADGRGVLDLAGGSFDGEVTRADVTLARHWFPGAAGGTVSGPLHVGSDGIHGDFTLRDGSLDAIGLNPTNIHGAVQLRYPLITAKLQGTVLGGDVQAEGTVNIAARHWEAHGQGSPQLAAAAAWLGRGQFPASDRIPLTGSASTTLDVAGWTGVHVSGTAHGNGAIAGLPLAGLASDFSYDTQRGVTVQATGAVAQGPTVVTVASGPAGTRIEANAKQMAPLPGQRVDAQLQVELTAKGAGGTLRLTDHASLPDRQAVVSLDAGLNGDGWQGVVQGSDGLGGRLEGALALAAGTLSGELRVHSLTLPGLTSPIDASLRADGPVTALPLTLTLGVGAPVTAGLAGETLEADLSGQVHAVLEGARLRQMRAALGPLTASGELRLAPLSGTLGVELAPTALRGPVTARLSLAGGTIGIGPNGLQPHGTVDVGTVLAGPLRYRPGPLELAAGSGPGASLVATSKDGHVIVEVGAGGARATLSRTSFVLAGLPVTADGSVRLPFGTAGTAGTATTRSAAPLAALRPDLTLHNGDAALTLRPSDGNLALELTAPAGGRLGPFSLAQPLHLTGEADLAAAHADLTGALGSVPLSAAVAWPAGGLRAQASAGSQPGRLDAILTAQGWSLTGSLPLAPVGSALTLPLTGTLRADLTAQRDAAGVRYLGTADVHVTAPLTGEVSLAGHGDRLEASLRSSLAGTPLRADGTLLPSLALVAHAGSLGPIDVRGGRLTGSGTLPARALAAGVDMPALPWTVGGSLSPLAIDLVLGGGHVHLAGGRLAADLRLPLRYRGQPLLAELATAGSGPLDDVAGAPQVRLDGGLGALPLAARLLTADGTSLLDVSGTPGALKLAGTVPAAVAAGPLPDALTPAGTIALTGEASLTGSSRYRLDARWQAGASTVIATLSGGAGGYRVDAQGGGFTFRASPGQATLTADAADLGPLFVRSPLDAALNGTLHLEEGRWSGALHARSTTPVPLSADLTGTDTGLVAALHAAYGPVQADVSGAVLPAPRLQLVARAYGAALRLEATTRGSWTDLRVAGTLTTSAVAAAPWVVLPSRRVSLAWEPLTGSLSASGDGLSLGGSITELRGSLTLPLRVAGIDETLAAHVAGSALRPTLSGSVTGAAVHGTFSAGVDSGLDTALVVSAAGMRAALGPGARLIAGDSSVDAHAALDGTWNATLGSALTVGAATLPLRATLDGRRASYTGTLALRSPAPDASLVSASIRGTGARLSAAADLSQVDFSRVGELLGVPLDVHASGELTVASQPLAATLRVRADGTVAGRKLTLEGHAGGTGGVDVTAAFGALTFGLARAGGADGVGAPLRLRVLSADGASRLEGTLALGASTVLALTGTVGGSPATVHADGDVSAGSGTLRLALGAASLDADLRRIDGTSALRLDVNAPTGSLQALGASLAGTVAAEVSLAQGAVTVQKLQVASPIGPTPWGLSLSGPAYPTADLKGTLAAPAWKLSGDVAVAGPASRLGITLRTGSLAVDAAMRGPRIDRVRADGAAQLGIAAQPIDIRAKELTWGPDTGFTGSATIRAPALLLGLPGDLVADVRGDGPLSAKLTAGPADRPWLRASAELAPNPFRDPTLQGSTAFDVPLTGLLGGATTADLRLTGHPALSGTWRTPSLAGDLAVQGALQAQGPVRIGRDGGSLSLHGDGLSLDASYRGGAWSGTFSMHDVALGPFDPRLDSAQLSLRADLAGGQGRNLQANVSSLELTAPGASLTGSGTLGSGLRVALQVSADLSRLSLPGPKLQGLVHGPLVLAAPSLAEVRQGTLIAVLDMARVGLAGTGGTVDGTLQVGGSPADPTLSATLQGAGEVHGQLRADARPARQRLDLHSTLSFRGVVTDLGLVLQNGRVEASGRARVGTAEADLSTDAQGRLQVTGAGSLLGWRATVAADLARAQLQGPLTSLGVHADGRVALTFGSEPWLSGRIEGTSFQGIELGTLSVTSQRPGAPIVLAGPNLNGSLQPTTLAWMLHLDALPLPAGLAASGDARGTAATGDATVHLTGTVAGSPVAVSLRASNRGGISLQGSGSALGGRLDLAAALAGGRQWTGSLSLTGAQTAGLGGSFEASLAGPASDPAVDGHLTLQGALEGSARLHVSPGRATIEAALQGAALGSAVHVAGSLAPTFDLTVSSAGSSGSSQGSVRLYETGGAVRADGTLDLSAGPVVVALAGSGPHTPVGIGLRVPALPGLAFHGELPAETPLALADTLRTAGLTLTGAGRTRGRLALEIAPAPRATLHDVRFDLGGTVLSASGTLTPTGTTLQGALALPDSFPVDHVGGSEVPYRLSLEKGALTLSSDGALGTLDAAIATTAGSGTVRADLHTIGVGGGVGAGTASIALSFDPSSGPSGTISVRDVQVSRSGLPSMTLSADVRVAAGRLTGSADVKAPHGGVHVDGGWGLGGWLPSALAPNAPSGGSLQARVNTFELASLPTVARLAPHVAGAVSGIVQLRGDTTVAQLVAPGFTVAGTALPLELQLSGPLTDLSAQLKLGSSVATATLSADRASGVLTLRRFPAQVLAEATAGTTDIRAEVDGLLRFDIPFSDPASSYLRMATEAIRLERAGVVTTGNLAFAYNDHAFTLEQAAFQGRGTWQAQGSVDADHLDLHLSANDADFGPLLGLIPMFARYGVGANGSFDLVAQGSPARPDVNLTANRLDAQVAGTRYRVDHANVTLKGSALTAVATVVGLAPLGGSLDAHGSAQLTLAPLALRNTDFRFTGSARVPVFGTVTDVSGGITQPPGSAPQLAISGKLGNPFTIRGSLAPFDVTLRGKGLDLQARPLLVTSSVVDANVTMKATPAGLALGGELDAAEIRMDLGAGSSSPPTSPSASPSATGAAATGNASTSAPTSGSQAALRAVVFDGLHLRAPQRVLLDASFGSMEAALDLTLTGTAAAPALAGTASALRGSLRFGGRDFTIDHALATFQPNRGVYPSLDVQAHSTFDKRRVLSGTTGVSFDSPRDTNFFTVTLAFSGQVQPAPQGPTPVKFDITPTLTSDATVQTGTDAATSSPRPLNDQELLSLITLGRLEVKPQFAGQAGIGTAVAQSAIDTAVNVLVVNELQNALSKALGLDVVEIRTTPLSSLLDNSGQPFGVSLRLGGYLTPELFASYRFGNVTGTGESYAFTNEVTLTYDLGPLNFDLSGQLSFPDSSATAGAVPQLGLGLRYAFTPAIGLEAGVDLSNVRQQARFGVSFHW